MTFRRSGRLRFCIPKLPLNTGDFLVSVFVGVHPNEVYDWVSDALAFSVVQSDVYGTGYVLIEGSRALRVSRIVRRSC